MLPDGHGRPTAAGATVEVAVGVATTQIARVAVTPATSRPRARAADGGCMGPPEVWWLVGSDAREERRPERDAEGRAVDKGSSRAVCGRRVDAEATPRRTPGGS